MFAAIAVDADFLALAEHAEVGILELVLWLPTGVEASHNTSDDGATGEDGDVFEHLLAAVAETGKRSLGFAPLLLKLCSTTVSLLCADYDPSMILRRWFGDGCRQSRRHTTTKWLQNSMLILPKIHERPYKRTCS